MFCRSSRTKSRNTCHSLSRVKFQSLFGLCENLGRDNANHISKRKCASWGIVISFLIVVGGTFSDCLNAPLSNPAQKQLYTTSFWYIFLLLIRSRSCETLVRRNARLGEIGAYFHRCRHRRVSWLITIKTKRYQIMR